jgi:hypothetical protein
MNAVTTSLLAVAALARFDIPLWAANVPVFEGP